MKNIKELLFKNMKKYTYTESYVTICGSKEALIENVSAVYECNEIMVRIKASSNEVIIWGEGLSASDYVNGTIKVSGKISSVEITSGGQAK